MKGTIALGGFALGKNNIAKETALPEGSLRDAINVDIDNAGKARLRRGYQQIYTGTNIHSLFKRYFIEDTNLMYLNADNTASLVKADFSSSQVAYAEMMDNIICTNSIGNWVITPHGVSRIGIKDPSSAAILLTTNGSLPVGQYQVSMQFIDTNTGEFSAASDIQVIELATPSGLRITNIPQPENADISVQIYVSLANGTALYRTLTVPYGTMSANITTVLDSDIALENADQKILPHGDFIAYNYGRTYVAQGKLLWYSEPMWYGQTNITRNFWQFASDITVLLALKNGIFVVADKTYFLSGTKPEDSQLNEVSSATGIKGTGLIVNAENLTSPSSEKGEVAYWFSDRGAVIGSPNGSILFASEDRLSVPSANKGNSMYTESNGIRQMITTLHTTGGMNSKIGATDSASIKILRNGVWI
ncbi:MAG: hypothetical protein DRQ35_04935 [Gammaproteobacteria bacterium]|nr:MAG: hypothetical protein DRQ35_04935 [Gammaproteobacteria bacterium]